jgi:hypothetical protein
MDETANVGGEETLPENVVGDVSQSFQFAARVGGVRQVDTLHSGMCVGAFEKYIANPEHRGTIG